MKNPPEASASEGSLSAFESSLQCDHRRLARTTRRGIAKATPQLFPQFEQARAHCFKPFVIGLIPDRDHIYTRSRIRRQLVFSSFFRRRSDFVETPDRIIRIGIRSPSCVTKKMTPRSCLKKTLFPYVHQSHQMHLIRRVWR